MSSNRRKRTRSVSVSFVMNIQQDIKIFFKSNKKTLEIQPLDGIVNDG